MARQFQVYDGAAPRSAQVGGRQVPAFADVPRNGAAVDAALGQLQDVGVRMARLHDLGVQQRVTQERDRIRTELDVELQKAADVAWGSDESLFRADGSVNSDRYDAIVARFREEAERVDPGEFLLGENAVRFAGEQEALGEDIGLQAMRFTALRSLHNTRKAFNDNLDLAVAREDWGAARGLIEDARGTLLNDTEAEIELLRLQRGRLRGLGRAVRGGGGSGVRVNVGGREYSGLSAALAMEAARGGDSGAFAGGGAAGVSSGVSSGGGALTLMPLAGGGVSAGGSLVGDDVSAGGGAGEVSLAGAGGDAEPALTETVVSGGDVDDMGGVLTLMPFSEFGEVVGAFADAVRVEEVPVASGGVEVRCAAHAPECVERVAAVGSAEGEISAEQARMMVARIALDAVADNPSVTDAQVVAMFDDAGVYEAMGEGDAAVGRERCRALVSEMVSRGRGDVSKLSVAGIRPMISAHLRSAEFAGSREWGRVAALNPGLEKDDDEWDKPDSEEGRARWFGLFEVYRKYRREYMPTASGDLDKEEFEEHAQRFYRWYMQHKYKALRDADVAAAQDWYAQRVADELRARVYADVEGGAAYTGYGSDVQVVRGVLREAAPVRLGADELVAMREEAMRRDVERSAAFRHAAQADYERLREARAGYAERRAERDRSTRAEAQRAERDAERDAARRLFAARSAVREADWVWDGEDAADGAQPGCLLPEVEYRRLQEELGFDGSQVVYVQVNGARIQVTGVSRSGRLELNSPAVAKVQKAPNARRGERWRTSGRLGFSYYFRSAEAK